MVNKSIFFSALAAVLLMGTAPAFADDEAAPPLEATDEPSEVEVGAEEAAAAAAKSDEVLAVPSNPSPETAPVEKTTVETTTVEKVTTEKVVEVKPADPAPAEVQKAPAKKKSVAKTEHKKKTKTAKSTVKPKLAPPVVAKAERRPPAKRTGQTQPLSDFELGRYQYCGSDRDCVAANNGCCDCANGGADVAVNRERLAAFEARFDCLYVSCTEKGAMPPCGSGIISCVNHKCVYFSNGSLEEKF